MRTRPPARITALPAEHHARLMEHAQEVHFARGTRLFNEGGLADRFWILKSGVVALDLHVPGRQAAVVESVGSGELVGWSWMVTPHQWHLGGEAVTLVHADQFDAATVRMLMEADPVFGSAVGSWVSQVLAHRLQAARIRLLDLYAPHGSGSTF